MTVKSVYMMTDLEGVAGVDDWDPRHREDATTAKGVYDRAEMQRLLTGEVNAAAEGLFAAGVEEVIINDAHGAGRTILSEELVSGVKLVQGVKRPCWLPGLSPRFDALIQVGMHAMTGTPNGCLAHSMSRDMVYRVNGTEVGEMEMAAYLCGHLGVPWVFTSGDLHACTESQRWVSGIVTAPVKEGLGELCALHIAPADARALIKTRVQEAVAAARDIEPLVAKSPVVMEVTHPEPDRLSVPEGVERVDDVTIRYSGESFWQVFHNLFYGKPDYPVPA
ncbi:MAG: M55 family metallopeptidase [Gemmatimonadetes bacterium]|nr:M55 family metallopeptidase [Gemmatimonadota bacterium]MDE3259613.1 M55 family metallopeptidase [Gemmatimonadota bacterium]